jgi:hypothetical protein
VNVEWSRLTWPLILIMGACAGAAWEFGGWPWLAGAIAAAAVSTFAIVTDNGMD